MSPRYLVARGLFLRLMPPIPQTTRHPGRLLTIAATVIALLVAAQLLRQPEADAALGDPLDPPPPNIVLVTTDDQPASTVTRAVMPNLFRRMADPGSSFEDYVVTTPLCCPSRATLLTGQYGHNNGVLSNNYALLDGKRNVLPVWLRRAGYSTAHVGKFLNEYGTFAGNPRDVAPGWDLWFTQFEKKAYYEWDASKNGKKQTFGSEDDDHLTEVTNRRAARWTRKLAGKPQPFFMQLDYYAPHGAVGRDPRCVGAPEPAPADVGRAAALGLPTPPSFNEPDISDKPDFIQARQPFGPGLIEATAQRYRCTIESLFAVDRGIEAIFREVEEAGELDRTVFIFTSDNGYFFGEHRIDRGKPFPYEENLRMPLVVLVPDQYRRGAPRRGVIGASTANLDVVPTILELTGAEPCGPGGSCRVLDGRSMMPLLDGRGGWPAARSLLIERDNCSFRGIRDDRQIYIEHGAGPLPQSGRCVPNGIEHYDLRADPFQLENLYPAPRRSADGELQLDLQRRMVRLGDCAGIAGRDPLPPSRVYCQ